MSDAIPIERQVWFSMLQKVGLQACKGLNSIVIVGVWSIWNHHSRCVFYGILPNLVGVLMLATEGSFGLAGPRGLSYLAALEPNGGFCSRSRSGCL